MYAEIVDCGNETFCFGGNELFEILGGHFGTLIISAGGTAQQYPFSPPVKIDCKANDEAGIFT
jgi:hypothetical protein